MSITASGSCRDLRHRIGPKAQLCIRSLWTDSVMGSFNDVVTGEYAYIDEHVKKVEDWNRPPQAMDVRDFYGGDLQGVWINWIISRIWE